MNNIYTDKNSFRLKAKSIQKSLNTALISDKIVKSIKRWNLYKKAENIMLFYPINSEISLLELLNDDNKNFFFPIINHDEINPVRYNKFSGFKKGKYNIPEPIGEELKDLGKIDLIFIPALAADTNGYRLGYGKGYYDRFLKSLSQNTLKVIPICEELLFTEIPKEEHDMPADCLITENNFIFTTH